VCLGRCKFIIQRLIFRNDLFKKHQNPKFVQFRQKKQKEVEEEAAKALIVTSRQSSLLAGAV
jgi:hypothetical protein